MIVSAQHLYMFHMKENPGIALTCQPQADVLLLGVVCSWLPLSAALCPRGWQPLLTLQKGGAHIALALSLGPFHDFSLAHTLTGSLLQPRLAKK